MNYFYLKGLDKIGPLSRDELKKVEGLTPNTLVWYETLAEWTKISDLVELNSDMFGTVKTIVPPPIPQEIIDKENETIQEVKKQEKQKSKFSAIRVSVSLVVILISLGISYKIFDNKVEKSKTELLDKIELIFQGKISVCDGVKYQIEGTLKKLGKPIVKDDDIFNSFTLSEYIRKKNQGIVEEFTLSSGGFTVYQISKEDNGYVVERTDARDMIYKVGLYENRYGYSMPSNRPTVEKCYAGALDYLTIENNDGSYTANVFNKIQNFADLSSDLFYIANVRKPSNPYSDHWWQQNAGSVYTSQYAVYLKKDFKYYEIKPNKQATNKLLFSVLLIGIIVGVIFIIAFNLTLAKFNFEFK